MIFKQIIILFIFVINLFASYQQVKIGKISPRYKDKLTETQLKKIIQEIEKNLESTVGLNLFDLKPNNATSKPIDILYVPREKLEIKYEEKLQQLKKIKQKMNDFKKNLPNIRKEIQELDKKRENLEKDHTAEITAEMQLAKKKVAKQEQILNQKIEDRNKFIRKVNQKNKRGQLTKADYQEISKVEKKLVQKIRLQEQKTKKVLQNYNRLIKIYNQKVMLFHKSFEKNYNKIQNSYNRKIALYNSYIIDYNKVVVSTESIRRNLNKVKVMGKTFGESEIDIMSFYENGRKVKTTRVTNTTMNKIEIYGFKNLNGLKVVLAHELLHLVGVPHINIKGALMHPLLQKEQLEKLELTKQDIQNIKKNF